MPLPPFGNANPLSNRISRARPGSAYGQGAALGGPGGGGPSDAGAGAVPGASSQPTPAGQPTPDIHAGAVANPAHPAQQSYQGTDIAGQWYDNRVVAPQQAVPGAGAGGGNGIELPPPPNPNHPAIEVPPPGYGGVPGAGSPANAMNLPPPHGGYARPNWMGPYGGSMPPQQAAGGPGTPGNPAAGAPGKTPARGAGANTSTPIQPPNQYANPAYGAQITSPNTPGQIYPAAPIQPIPPKNPTDMPPIPGATPPPSGMAPAGQGGQNVGGNTYNPNGAPPPGFHWETNARGQQILVRG
jgi:hypothetical protein